MEKVEGGCVYEFGEFRVDAVQRLLLLKADGRPLPLVSRAFEMLLYFVQHHGELLDKATLMKAVWPNVIVEENNLNQSITAIRRVLGESPGEHRFIVTVPGRGYRFVAEVTTATVRPSGTGKAAMQLDAPSQRDAMLRPQVLVNPHPVSDSPPRSALPRTRKRTLNYSVGFLLLAALSYYAINRVLLSPKPTAIVAHSVTERSIAVLSFENRSEDPANAYFAAGIQDEILTLLSKIGALKVISQSSTDHSAANLPDLARHLGVAHLLRGSVQKVGDRVRINVQLVNAAANNHLWAETYERNLTDVFAVESEVARAIADTLQAKLTGAEQRELTMKPTQNPDAYDAYLRGVADPQLRSSIEAFEEAVRLDPNFATAWAWLARRQAVIISNNVDRSASRRDAARQALEAAVRLRPDLTETQIAQGFYRYGVEGDYEGAERIFVQVWQKSPNHAVAAEALAMIAREQGRWQESLAHFKEAIALDPQNAFTRHLLCDTYLLTRQFAVALKACDAALNVLPGDVRAFRTKATIYQALGELNRADAMLAALKLTPGDALALSVLSYQAVLQHRYPATIALLQWHLANPAALGSRVGSTRRWLGDLQRLAGDAAGAKASYLQARDELQAELKSQPDNFEFIADLGLVYAGLRDQHAALEHAEQAVALGLKAKRASRIVPIETTLARIEARFGDNDRAIAALQLLLAASGGLPPLTPAQLRLDPDWDGLRADPRFQQLVGADGTSKP